MSKQAKQKYIVAEVSKNWRIGGDLPQRPTDCIGGKFEEVIEFNHQRGYKLHSWKMNQYANGVGVVAETIVAVF